MSRRRPRPSLAPALTTLSLVRLLLNSVERSVYPFLPAIARGLNVPLAQAGLLLTARAGGAFTVPFTVAVGGRGGRHRRLAMVALGLFVAAMLLAGGPGLYATTMAGFVLFGAARPAYDVASQAYLSDRTPYERRARILAVLELTYAGGLLVGAPVVGWLIGRFSWRAPFLAAAVVALAALAAVQVTLADGGSVRAPRLPRSFRPDADGIALLATMFLFTFGTDVTLVVFGAWLEQDFGLSLLALGGVSTLVGLAELAGESFTLAFGDRIGKRRTVATGLVMGLAAYLLLPFTDTSVATGLATLALALAGFELTIVAGIPMASEMQPDTRSSFLALTGVALAAARGVSAAVSPRIFAAWGLAGNAHVSAAAYALALTLLVLRVRERGLR